MLTATDSEILVIRYGEIALKGGMRSHFEQRLIANLRSALADAPGLRFERMRGRILIAADGPLDALAAAAARVFGIISLSSAATCAPEESAIQATARARTAAELQAGFPGADPVRFAVRVNRADRRFPLTSEVLARRLGADLIGLHPRLRVHLDAPELRIEVDVRETRALVFAERQAGPGGLPVGTLGRGLCLLSGGIDSPVAAWQAMRRGLRIELLTFVSPPHTGAQTVAKVERLTETLSRWQPITWLHVVSMTAVQEEIRRAAPDPLGTVLDRRAMMRMACRLARRRHARALVTGESLGQVASQTLENLAAIEEAADLPVLRPLIAHDKQDTIRVAEALGTYPISTLPAPDSCTVWLPRAPALRARLRDVLAAEEGLPLAALEAEALRTLTSRRIPT